MNLIVVASTKNFLFSFLTVYSNAEGWRKQEAVSDSAVMSPPPAAPFIRLSPAIVTSHNSAPFAGVGKYSHFLPLQLNLEEKNLPSVF